MLLDHMESSTKPETCLVSLWVTGRIKGVNVAVVVVTAVNEHQIKMGNGKRLPTEN